MDKHGLSVSKGPDYTVVANKDLRIEEEEKHGGSFLQMNDIEEDGVVQLQASKGLDLSRESKVIVKDGDLDLSPTKSQI